MKFKNEKDMLLFTSLHPVLVMIYSDLVWYAKSKYNIDLVCTQTISTLKEDQELKRVSSSHREARAIDIRTKDIDAFIVQDLIQYINSKDEYKQYHYMSNNGVMRLAYYHIGNAEHLHLAIHRKFKIDG